MKNDMSPKMPRERNNRKFQKLQNQNTKTKSKKYFKSQVLFRK